MIEVEKKFQPTEEQLQALLKDSQFLREVLNDDVLYDYPDYGMFKKHIRLRNRNGNFELKLPISSSASEEIEDEEEIKKYFNTNDSLQDFVDKNLTVLMEIKTHRKKYKKDNFAIDVDTLDFGYSICEIELLVENEEQVAQANDKILKLAKNYNWEIKNLPSKREQYLKLFRPDLYKIFFPAQ